MTEYIDRELARQVICGWCEYDTCPGYDYYWDKCDAKRRLDDIPSADVVPKEQYEQDRKEWLDRYIKEHDARIKTIKDYHDYQPVVHGHWKMYDICSVCDDLNEFQTNYCPNCGAKMDEVIDDG